MSNIKDKQIILLLQQVKILNSMDRTHIRSKYFMELNKDELLAIANSPVLSDQLKEHAIMELKTFSMR